MGISHFSPHPAELVDIETLNCIRIFWGPDRYIMQPYCLLLWSGALIALEFCIAGQVAFQSADGSINRRYMCRGTATMEFPQLHHIASIGYIGSQYLHLNVES